MPAGILTRDVKAAFLSGTNEAVLRAANADAYERCLQAENLQAFMQAHHCFAGFDSHEEYLRGNNPMAFMHGVSVPTLVV